MVFFLPFLDTNLYLDRKYDIIVSISFIIWYVLGESNSNDTLHFKNSIFSDKGNMGHVSRFRQAIQYQNFIFYSQSWFYGSQFHRLQRHVEMGSTECIKHIVRSLVKLKSPS